MMTKKEAKAYLNSATVEKTPFTFTFTQRTLHKTSQDMFLEAVEALDGWIVRKWSYLQQPNPLLDRYVAIYETEANIPSAIK